MHDSSEKDRRTSENGKRTFKSKPRKIDIEALGPWLVERNRNVLDMLEEYDRRQEMQKTQKR